jgi:hypothetical protein
MYVCFLVALLNNLIFRHNIRSMNGGLKHCTSPWNCGGCYRAYTNIIHRLHPSWSNPHKLVTPTWLVCGPWRWFFRTQHFSLSQKILSIWNTPKFHRRSTRLQESTNDLHLEPDESNSHVPIPFLKRSINSVTSWCVSSARSTYSS